MVRLKFQQKCLCVFWPSCLFVCLIFCLLSLWPFLPICFLLSTYVFFCGVFVYLLALFVPFVFSPFWVLSLRVLIMSEISELAPSIWYDQCNVSCSQYTSRCECIFHDIEKERKREGEKQSWSLHWELRAIVALSCPESTFDNNSYIFKALLQARIRLNSTLRTFVPLTMFDNIQVVVVVV